MALRGYKPKYKKALWVIETPCRMLNTPKPLERKPIRRVSKSRAVEVRKYNKRVPGYLAEHPRCAVFQNPEAYAAARRAGYKPLHGSRQVHHIRGRRGRLLLDERFWLPVSNGGHDWIHARPEDAQRFGLLAGPGEWLKET